MRVLAYADSRIFSGAEAVYCDLIDGLAANSAIELRCAAPRSNSELAARLFAAAGEKPVDVPSQRPSAAAIDLYSPFRLKAAGRVLAEVEHDVLLANLPSAEYGPTPMLVRRRPNAKSIGFLHVPVSFRELGFRMAGVRELLARRALSRFDVICVIAGSAEETFHRVWDREGTPVCVIPLPRPKLKPVPSDEARRALGLPGGTIVGMAGRISFKQKGQDTFVEAAARLLRQRPSLHFAIAGEGRDMPRLHALLRRLGIEHQVSLLGQVKRIEQFLSAVDVIVIPSRFEGLPLIALEALACGVPGIASSIDGLIDVWPEPWWIEPGNAASLAEGLIRVLDTPPDEQALLIAQGRELATACTNPNPASVLESVILQVANE